MAMVEKAFGAAYGVVMKNEAPSITKLEDWLASNTVRVEEVPTPFGHTTYMPLNFGVISTMPKARMATIPELVEIGKFHMDEKSLGSLDKLLEAVAQIGFFSADYRTGENRNIVKGALLLHSNNVYKGYESTYSEHTGLTSLSLHSKYVYGCHRIIDSQFCLKCYNSVYLNRCFEMDGCIKCADSYFCHNSEALQDCMFCFNMKGRRHMIGNTELPKEKYSQIKKRLLEQIGSEITKTGGLKWDICGIG